VTACDAPRAWYRACVRAAFVIVILSSSAALADAPQRYSSGFTVHESADARDLVAVIRPVPSGRVLVPGGTFTMGSTPIQMASAIALCEREPLGPVKVPFEQSNGDLHLLSAHCDFLRFEAEGTAHSVTLSTFLMDRTEVTVADYTRCVAVGACSPPGFRAGDARFSDARFPVVDVAWTDARDYCAFAHGRLPTEAEWEYAARGPTGKLFPWGDVWNPHLANHGSIALDPTDATDGFAGLAPVGSIPDGKTPLGLLDMAGNAAEWVADSIGLDTEKSSRELIPLPYPPAAIVNPRNQSGTMRMIRGGSYLQGADAQRSAARMITYETRRLPSVGFRCASDP
jgi:formylglycine-generating enzyme required for sulfatase activity